MASWWVTWSLTGSVRNVIFKELSCGCWENVAPLDRTGIPAHGGGLVGASCGYMVHGAGAEDAEGQRSILMCTCFLSCRKT